MRGHVLCLAAIAAGGCIPTRDNASDPNNRPVIAMAVTVAGRTAALGGRNEEWRLDATGSRAKHGSLKLEWAISSDGPNLPSDVTEWTDVGSDVVVVSSAGTLLRDQLVAIDDFQGFEQPGTGIASRWIRLVASDDLSSSTTAIPISIVNTPPTVDVGIDYRIAPGGQWWTGTGDGLDALPWEVIVEATVGDAEGDASLLFTPGYQGTWTVRGSLAEYLDLDLNGVIDAPFIENSGRSLRFPAPLFPTRGEIALDVWDVNRAHVRLSHGIDSARVDVLTSEWIVDDDTGGIQRVDTSAFSHEGPETRVLASDGRRSVVGIKTAGSTYLHLRNHRFEDVATPLGPLPATTPITRPREAVSDGVGGWWFTDLPGKISHMREKNGALVFDKGATQCPPDPLTSCIGTVGTSADLRSLHASGTGTVWALGRSTDFLEDRILEISSSGAVIVEEAAVPGSALASAAAILLDDSGPWILARTPMGASLQRRNAAAMETLPDSSSALVIPDGGYWEPRSGAILVLTRDPNGTKSRLYRREANGSWTFGVIPRSYKILRDPGSGDALVGVATGSDESSGLMRFDARTFERTDAQLGFTPEGMAVFEGGSVLSGTSAGGALEWIEAASSPEHPVFTEEALTPVSGGVHGLALDPATGQIWLARADLDLLQRFGPDGSLLSTTALPGDAERAHITLDAVNRMGWLATGPLDPLDGTGQLLRFDLPLTVLASPAIEAVDEVGPIQALGGIAVLPAEGVCVGGYLDSTRRTGFVWRPATGQLAVAAPDAATNDFPHRAFADPRFGACWFFDEKTDSPPTTGAARFARDGSTETFTWPDAAFNNDFPTGIAAVVSSDFLFAITRHDGFSSPWLGWYSPGTPSFQTSASFPTLSPFEPALTDATEQVKNLSGDGFYGHYFLAIEKYGAPSAVIRLDASGRELSRFFGPEDAIPVCR